ncbi:MAG: ATPase, T2SS/T4P/T4SS family [Acidimicrobiales bacterium]
MDEAALREQMRSANGAARHIAGVHDGLVTTKDTGLDGLDELAASGRLTDISAWDDGECWVQGPPLGPGWHPGPALFSSRTELIEAAGELAARAGYPGDLQAAPRSVWADATGLRTWIELSGLRANLTLRVPYLRAFSRTELVSSGMMSAEVASFVWDAFAQHLTLLIAGPGDAGKTTVIRALIESLDPSERTLTMEELPELHVSRRNVVALAGRPANAEGVGAHRLRELVDHALYGSADRLVVGELRGPEADSFLRALSSGHKGGLGAIHAGTARQAATELVRYATEGMGPDSAEAAAGRVRAGIDLIVVLADKSARGVIEIAEVSTGDPLDRSEVPLGTLWERGHWLVDPAEWWAQR